MWSELFLPFLAAGHLHTERKSGCSLSPLSSYSQSLPAHTWVPHQCVYLVKLGIREDMCISHHFSRIQNLVWYMVKSPLTLPVFLKSPFWMSLNFWSCFQIVIFFFLVCDIESSILFSKKAFFKVWEIPAKQSFLQFGLNCKSNCAALIFLMSLVLWHHPRMEIALDQAPCSWGTAGHPVVTTDCRLGPWLLLIIPKRFCVFALRTAK